MKILSVNVGKPKSHILNGITIETSMVKEPQNQIHVNKDAIEGDEFKSPTLHGTLETDFIALRVEQNPTRLPNWVH
jgi:MOSC domain-containing protein YiiM